MTTVVRILDLNRRFGNTLALDQVSFQAEAGKVYGLVGANGAGKTTLIKHILGLLRPQSGTVEVLGLNPVQQPQQVLSRLGYLSENRDLPDWMSVREFMRYNSAFYPNWDDDYCADLLTTFSLNHNKKIKELSRGMRAQVALIAAVAHRPQLLVLDEPSSGLDAIVRKDILNAVVRTISEEGRTVIFSSHLLEEVERLSDHVTMINQGRIALDGDLEELTRNHRHTELKFTDPLVSAPVIEGALLVEGEARAWTVIHAGNEEKFNAAVNALGGEVLQSRRATLEEIFLARVGRGYAEELAA